MKLTGARRNILGFIVICPAHSQIESVVVVTFPCNPWQGKGIVIRITRSLSHVSHAEKLNSCMLATGKSQGSMADSSIR